MRLHSSRVARILSRKPNSALNLNLKFDIPRNLYDKIIELDDGASTKSRTDLLTEIFTLSRDHREKAAIGSLLLEHQVRLPLKLEIEFLDALLDTGYVSAAYKLWLQRDEERNHTEWTRIGILLLCKSFRMRIAEDLAAKLTNFDKKICLAFVMAYAKLRQEPGCDNWLPRFFKTSPTSKQANSVLRELVSAKMWSQVQQCFVEFGKLGIKVNADITSACILESNPDPVTVASLLCEDGSLVNNSRFQRAISRDVRTQINESTSSSEAIRIAERYTGPHEIFICYEVLKRYGSDPRLVSKVAKSTIRDSVYIQFMLEHYRQRQQAPWPFVIGLNLHTLSPKILMNNANYCSLWTTIRNSDSVPFPLRDFMISTIARTPLTPQLFQIMVKTLKYAGDPPAIHALFEFAHSCNLVEDWKAEAEEAVGPAPRDAAFNNKLV